MRYWGHVGICINISTSVRLSANQRALFAYVNVVLTEHKLKHRHKKTVMLMLMSRLSSLAHKLLMLMLMLMLASQVRTDLSAWVNYISMSHVTCFIMQNQLPCESKIPFSPLDERREEILVRNRSIFYRACANYELINRRIKPKLASFNTTLSSACFANCRLVADMNH